MVFIVKKINKNKLVVQRKVPDSFNRLLFLRSLRKRLRFSRTEWILRYSMCVRESTKTKGKRKTEDETPCKMWTRVRVCVGHENFTPVAFTLSVSVFHTIHTLCECTSILSHSWTSRTTLCNLTIWIPQWGFLFAHIRKKIFLCFLIRFKLSF